MCSVVNNNENYRVIVTGTDPKSRKGGIGFALPGYLHALDRAHIHYVQITTYRPDGFIGKHVLFLLKIPRILNEIRRVRKSGMYCIIYSHAGSGISLFREGVIALCVKGLGAKTVVQIHSIDTIKYIDNPFKRVLFRLALTGFDSLFLLTPWWQKYYENRKILKPIKIIPNPLPLALEKKARQAVNFCSNSKTLQVLLMSRMVKGKGVELVLEAVPYIRLPVRIHIAGDGDLLTKIKEKTKQLNIENKVSFHGWVSGKEKQALFDEADIFCHPTQFDAMPMNILEAMANGLPVVALNWGAIPDLVPDQKAGILVEKADAKKVAYAIEKLQDTEMRKKMASAAKMWVLENFTAEKVGIRLHEAFTGLTGQ